MEGCKVGAAKGREVLLGWRKRPGAGGQVSRSKAVVVAAQKRHRRAPHAFPWKDTRHAIFFQPSTSKTLSVLGLGAGLLHVAKVMPRLLDVLDCEGALPILSVILQ